MKRNLVGTIVGCASLVAWSAGADTITLDTGLTTLGGQTVDAEAMFTTKAGELDITLRNLVVNPISVAQNLSGLSFTLSTGQSSGTLFSSSGMERTVNSTLPGGFVNGSTVSTGWGLTGLFLNVLGTPEAPQHTIIGAPAGSGLLSAYSAAKGSIGGPHNPFLAGDVTFVINIPTLTAKSDVTSATFQFNTSPGSALTVTTPDGGTTVLLLGMALSGLALLRRKVS